MEKNKPQVQADSNLPEGAAPETEEQNPQLQQAETAEVENDDKDPVEVLRQVAEELGVKDVKLLTEKELRSTIDREVTKAIKTRDEKLKKEAEKKLLEEQGKYEELLKLERVEALENLKKEFLTMAQLEKFEEFIDVKAFAEKPLADGTAELKEMLNGLKEFVDDVVEERVKQRIAEMQKGTAQPTTPSGSETVGGWQEKLSKRLQGLG